MVERPIFIVGMGRSGTTLLSTILARHSEIAVTPETHFLKWLHLEGDGNETPIDFDRFWSRYTDTHRFLDLKISADLCRELIAREDDYSFKAIFSIILDQYRKLLRKPRIGEKTPSHIRSISRLLRWYPDAKIIVCIRDPRAIIASHLKTPWVDDHLRPLSLRRGLLIGKRIELISYFSREWNYVYGRCLKEVEEDQRIAVIQYENLVSHSSSEIRALCAELGEAYEPSMLMSSEEASIVRSGPGFANEGWEKWRRQHEDKSSAQISSSSLAKWPRKLSRSEIAMIEGLCGNMMRKLDYKFTQPLAIRLFGAAANTAVATLCQAESAIRSKLIPWQTRRPFEIGFGSKWPG